MVTICIKEFAGYTAPMFLDFLEAQPSFFFDIIVPKYFGADDPGLRFYDYYRALYTSELLGNISEDIMHTMPDPDAPGEFSFLIATTRQKELAALLEKIYLGYEGETSRDPADVAAFDTFEQEAVDFLDSLRSGDVVLHCPYFLDMLNEIY